jgi:hypothetical protein
VDRASGAAMSRRLAIAELGPRAVAEIKMAILLYGWLPSLIATCALSVSIWRDLVAPGPHWTQRAGSVVTILGVFVAFVDSNLTTKFNPIDFSNAGRVELPFKYFAIALAGFGTLIWGYGDLWL